MYKRLTKKDEFGNADIIGLSTEKLFSELCFDETNLLTKALNKLAFLETKIENGTLIELKKPYIVQNEQSGCYEVWWQEVVTRFDWRLTEAESEAKLKELKGEKE